MRTAAAILDRQDFRAVTQPGTNTSKEQASRQVITSTLNMLKSMRLLNLTDADSYRVWERGLSDLTDAELRNGLVNARDCKEFFNLPTFRELCRKVDANKYGLPPARQAYEEACMAPAPKARQKWSHPAVYHAGVATGWHELSCTPTAQIFPRFEYHYAEMCRRVMAGEELTLPVVQAIPSHVPDICTREENIKRMQALREATGL